MTELIRKIEVIKELSAMFDRIDFNLVFHDGDDGYVNIEDNICSKEQAEQVYELIDFLSVNSSMIELITSSTYYRYNGVGFFLDDKVIKEADYTLKLWS